MSRFLFVMAAAIACLSPLRAQALPAVTPIPAVMQAGEGHFTLDEHTRIVIPVHDDDARNAATYLQDMLLRTRGLKLDLIEGGPPADGAAIVFVRLQTFAATKPDSYHLDVMPNAIRIAAADHGGLFYGAVTAWQLATQDAGKGPAQIDAITIDDAPRFAWRGLMVDSVRHFQSPAEIRKIIDAMATQKLNIMQWNLADDQGWRLQVPAYPKLTEVAAFRHEAGAAGGLYGGFYTQQNVRDIVAYAADRNITIVPEIDMPGHATAAITAYPELGTTGKKPAQSLSDWGVYPNLYNVDDKTFAFIDTVLDEVMDLFPSPYIHVGGDEAIKTQWQASRAIHARIKALHLKDEDALQSYFITRVGQHIAARGRRLIGWDEILQGGVTPDATVMSWRGLQGAVDAAALGHDTVLSPSPDLYFDARQSASADEPPGRAHILTLKDVYAFNPAPDGMSDGDRRHILGLQANVWTEYIRTDERFEQMAFPRAIAVAEIGWSPEASHDWGDFAGRLPADLERLSAIGVGYDQVPFEPQITLSSGKAGRVTAALSTALGLGEIHYTTDGTPPQMSSPLYSTALSLPMGTPLLTRSFVDGQPLGNRKTYSLTQAVLETRSSYQLALCSHDLDLALEDDYPASGPRPVVVLDTEHPCWMWPGAKTGRGLKATFHIAGFPFNFQLADALPDVSFDRPLTRQSELLIRLDRCTGKPWRRIPLGKAGQNPGLSTLEADLPARTGVHKLCFSFAQRQAAPEWAIDDVRLSPRQ